MNKLRKYTDEIGGVSEMAKLLNVSISLVSHWLTGFRPVTPEKAKLIEEVTNGAVTRADLRPDVFL